MSLQASSPKTGNPGALQLPRSSTRLDKGYTFCKVVTRVRRDKAYQIGFEGPIYPPGARVPIEVFGPRPLVVENAGPDRPGRGHNRMPSRWILWSWDFSHSEWVQLAQTYAISAEWAEVLKEPAIRALTPARPELFDVLARGRELAGLGVTYFDQLIAIEESDVQLNAWVALLDIVPGRIVAYQT